MKLDVLFINPNSSEKVYQDLSKDFAAIEVPVWSLLLAQSCRSKGHGVAILDCDAERLADEQAAARIREIDPRLVCFVVYGQNPNSGTTNMTGAISLCSLLKQTYPQYKTCFVGSHTSALPLEVLGYESVDLILQNEGVYALHNLLKTDLENDLQNVKGIGYKDADRKPCLSAPEGVVPQARMDQDLPGSAWDLLPKRQRPLDLYRAHFWHADFNHNYRTPAAALYTSLGCRFKCDFCMINILNRTNNTDGATSADSAMMRFWSPEFIIKEFDKLVDMGVQTIRLSDEMFFLDKRFFEPLLKLIHERGYGKDLRMWAYSRVDTVRPRYLEMFLSAGVRWLALGIEAANRTVRKEVAKGSFEDVDIKEVVKEVRDHGIHVIANYIFGLPDDTQETMQETLDLSIELNTEMWNGYPAMALPGSPLYQTAKKNGWNLPDSYEGYGFLSYDCQPLPTKFLSAADVLRFRDEAFYKYFKRPQYLDLIERKFGAQQRANFLELLKVGLNRKLLGHQNGSVL
jgi:anaerobic magnesium-protoporphyrin IX monomethyl ester cyclase